MVEAIVTDWDGTLADPSGQVTPRTQQALRDFQDQGGLLVIASGRLFEGVRLAASRSHLDLSRAVVIGGNGTMIATGTGQEIAAMPLDFDTAQRAWNFGISHGLVPVAMGENGDVYCMDNSYPPVAMDIEESGYIPVEISPDELPDLPYLKILETGYPRVEPSLVELFSTEFAADAYCVLSAPHFLEVTKPGTSKGDTLRRLCALRGIDPANVVAFGDHNNDQTMLEVAGLGVAMGNAVPELKAGADMVAKTNAEDGLAQVVEDILAGRLMK